MPFKATNENGEEIEAYTAEEIEAQKGEAVTARKEADEAKAEVERLNGHLNMQKENFKKLNEYSEEERSKFSAEKIEMMKRQEAAEAKATALENKYNDDQKARITSDKEKALAKYHGGNAELKAALEKNFELINLQGDTTEIIEERAKLAANMEKGKIGIGNPLMANLNGEAPSIKNKGETEKFMESDKAKQALKLMGDEPAKK